MKYLKLYEGFKSEIVSNTLSFINDESKIKFLDTLKYICEHMDFPLSELKDEFFQKLNFNKALNLFVDKDHQVGKTKWVKFWFDRNGKYICASIVDGSIKKNVESGVLSDYEIVKDLTFGEIIRLETGDKVYIKLEYHSDPVLATVYRGIRYDGDDEKVFVIQNEFKGTEPNDNEWRKFGQFGWLISDEYQYKGVPKLLKKRETKKENLPNPYEYNFYSPNGINKTTHKLKDYLVSANFAIVLDFEKLENSEYDIIDIKNKRQTSKKGALALMKDSDIKSMNLNRYFKAISYKIEFNQDLSNFKYLFLKSIGGRKMLYWILKGHIDTTESLIYNLYKFIKVENEDNQNKKEAIADISNDIKYSVKSSSENRMKENLELEKRISEIKKLLNKGSDKEKSKLILEILNKYEKLCNDFFLLFNKQEIQSLDDAEVIIYKMWSIYKLIQNSNRFYDLRIFFNLLTSYSPEGFIHNYYSDNEYYKRVINLIDSFWSVISRMI